MEALILAAGKGTRMRGLCERVPKPMLSLANRPILDAAVQALADAGATKVFIVVGHMQEIIKERFRLRPPAIPVEFIVQVRVNGTGSAALLGKSRMKAEPFLLTFGDSICRVDNYRLVMERCARGDCDAVLSVHRDPDPVGGASVRMSDGFVTGIVEKPPPGAAPSPYNNAGLFVFPARMFEQLEALKPSPRGEYELTDAINRLIAEGGRVAAHEMAGYWYNLTDPETYLAANHSRLREMGMDYVISPDATTGDVEIGPNVSIGPHCRVAGGCRLAHCILCENVVVGAGAELRYMIASPGAAIPAGARVIGSAAKAMLTGL